MANSAMISRERVLASIQRKPVDRIPSDFRAETTTLERLYRHVGHRDYDRLLSDLKVDIRYIQTIDPPEIRVGDAIQNYWGERYIYRENEWGKYRDDLPGALNYATTLKDLKDFAWPTVDMIDHSHLAAQSRKAGDCAVCYGFGDIFTRPCIIRGFENFLMDMVDRPDFVHFIIGKITDFYLEEYARAHARSGGRIDIFLIMGDLATQIAPLFAPRWFDEYLAGPIRRLADRIHELGAYFMYHSCGEAYAFYDRLIACGVDIIDPIQRTSERMNPERLYAEFGGRACFHGGIDVQTTLPNGSEEDVRAEVRRYCAVFPTGYICTSAHYMQHDTPPENIITMYDEISKQ